MRDQHISTQEDGTPIIEGTTSANLKRILIVDDNKDQQTLMSHILTKSGFEVRTSSRAEEAFEVACTQQPLLIITDIEMPSKTGLDLLEMLKTDPRTKGAAVILVTAYHHRAEQVSKGLLLGADDYITRPFDIDEFKSRVKAVIRVKQAEWEAQRQAQIALQRNQELELINELALAVNASLSFQDISNSAIRKIAQLTGAETVALMLFNQVTHKLMVSVLSQGGNAVSVLHSTGSDDEAANLVLQRQVPNILTNILIQHQRELGLRDLPDRYAIQWLPLLNRERFVGAIAIADEQHRSKFDRVKWMLMHSAAAIIAVAAENTHLLEVTRKRVDDMIALDAISRALNSTLDMASILKQTTLLIQRVLQADATLLWRMDKERQELVLIAFSGTGIEAETNFRLPSTEGVVGYVAKSGQPDMIGDLAHEHKQAEPWSNYYRSGSLLSIPITLKEECLGVIQVLSRKVCQFDQDTLYLASPVAYAVGIALENARLFGEVQEFNHQLERMVTQRTEELAAEKEKTEAILASMADGLLVLDATGQLLMANTVAENMLGFRLSELLGRRPTAEQLQNPLWGRINEMIHGAEQTINVDLPADQVEQMLSIQANSAKLCAADGQIMGTVILLRDITTLKQIERMKARFMAGVTHELKTPLAVIRLHSDNMLKYDERLPHSKKIELLTSIQTQVSLLEQLIGNILQLSRLDAGLGQRERDPLDLCGLVDEIVTNLVPLAAAKHLTLAWRKPAAEIRMLGDRRQLEQVVRNLIDNAIKYTPPGGQVTITLEGSFHHHSPCLKLAVHDTGIGIPLSQQKQIFERFYRVDPSHTIPGTGLGLSLVKEIVEIYHGEIQLTSTPGEGSTFTVILPGLQWH